VELTPQQQDGRAPEPLRGAGSLVTGFAYTMLFVLGILEGVLGSFHYAGVLGPVPAAALGFDVVILASCVLSGWGMRSAVGGLMPAAGWFVATFVLSMGTRGGSVVITDTAAGKWFLFGGAACAVAGALLGFVRWSKARGWARPGLPSSRLPGQSPGP
jgi:Family of unknown function (DUF6113)